MTAVFITTYLLLSGIPLCAALYLTANGDALGFAAAMVFAALGNGTAWRVNTALIARWIAMYGDGEGDEG